MKPKKILVSVSDKSQLAPFVRPYSEAGAEIISTGGTASYLKSEGIKVKEISEETGFPEVMDGRVRTLHPHVHVPLLARRHSEEDMKLLEGLELAPYDMVICNLYPFEEALKEGKSGRALMEQIDIGGPTLLRAAAKNHESIVVLCDPKDYSLISDTEDVDIELRQKLASKVFYHVSSYDAMIAKQLGGRARFPQHSLGGEIVQELRYGENPQQKAEWYRRRGALGGLHDAEVIQGKQLSYNNLLDIAAATETLQCFGEQAVVSVKHNNPCGVALDERLATAAKKSIAADPISVFGGIVALGGRIDGDTADVLLSLFLEAVIAPDYSPEALDKLKKKKNLRVLKWPELCENDSKGEDIRMVLGGYLRQDSDSVHPWQGWEVHGEEPDEALRADIEFVWKAVARLKSNAIAIGKNKQTLGLGMGQVNRVDAVAQAIHRWKEFHGDVSNPVLCSDAFFPFPDSIEKASEAGIKWVVQPGGSIKDKEVIERSRALGVNLVMTGCRHFLH